MAEDRWFFAVFFLFAFAPISDARAVFSNEFENCMSAGLASQGSDPAMADCYRGEIERQKALLEQAYPAKMQSISDDMLRRRLAESQEHWERGYIESCRSTWADEEGGTLWRVLFYGCVASSLDERIDWLRAYPNEPVLPPRNRP